MKLRKVFCIAAALCMLCAVASADGHENYVYNYHASVNIMQASARPYNWESQTYRDSLIATHIDQALDGNRNTAMWFGCWAKAATDDIPDITFYFNNATVKDIWIRNGSEKTENFRDYARMGNLGVTVWVNDVATQLYFPRRPLYNKFYNLQDNYDEDLLSEDFIDGYQRFSLPQTYDHVTKIEFWVKGWYEGELQDNQHRYQMWISDIAFLPDSLVNLYGPGIFNPSYGLITPVPTAVPRAVPTAVPQPVITEAPATGIQVMTKEQLDTRSGPGTNYTETGAYLQAGQWVKAISSGYDKTSDTWWVQVELEYNGELRRVYTGVQRLQMAADQVTVEEGADSNAVVSRSVYPYWGPGYGYSMYGDKIPSGTQGTIWQRENMYAQFEYYDESARQIRRVWIPENALEESNG